MIPESVIGEITSRISKSVDRVLIDQEHGRIETEPSLTDRLLANIERDFESQSSQIAENKPGLTLKARTLRDRGPKAPENTYGADLVTILSVSLGKDRINKGILAQSKSVKGADVQCSSTVNTSYSNGKFYYADDLNLVHPSVNELKDGNIVFDMSVNEWKRLQMQCDQMLKISSDSFVFLYSSEDIYVVPATSIAGMIRASRISCHCKNFKSFFVDYMRCFIGDQRLRGTTDDDFDALMLNTGSPNLLFLEISGRTSR